MATGIPQNMYVQSGNQQILVSWDLVAGATSYIIQRSQDNITFSTIATVSGTPLATSYLDTSVVLGTQYWYKVAASDSEGSITFTGQPLAGETAVIDGVTFTAVAASPTGTEFVIGADLETTLTNFANIVNAIIPGVVAATSSATELVLNAYSSTTVTLTSALSNSTVTAFTAGSTSSFTIPQSAVPIQAGEMCLSQIRLAAMQRCDRVNSNFVTLPEWNSYINQAMYELYDLLVTVYEDYYIATPAAFSSNGSSYLYALPDGSTSFTNSLTGASFVPPAIYKLVGVDMQVQSSMNAWVTVPKFNFIDRNAYVYPNSSSTIYGVFNCRYRMIGNNLEFIPVPSGNQTFRVWYVPRLTQLLQDTDTTVTGISGWIEYVIAKAAFYALTKEESDTQSLVLQLVALTKRIEESAANRDVGMPDTISDSRSTHGYWGSRGSGQGNGGW